MKVWGELRRRRGELGRWTTGVSFMMCCQCVHRCLFSLPPIFWRKEVAETWEQNARQKLWILGDPSVFGRPFSTCWSPPNGSFVTSTSIPRLKIWGETPRWNMANLSWIPGKVELVHCELRIFGRSFWWVWWYEVVLCEEKTWHKVGTLHKGFLFGQISCDLFGKWSLSRSWRAYENSWVRST